MKERPATIFIGLEVHVQLNSAKKMFCTCSTLFGDRPNRNVCPICLGYPGVLPALNEDALRKAYVVARALDCTLATETAFARKNYFYPDLPKNYQISQFSSPVGRDGRIRLDTATGEAHSTQKTRVIEINEIHLEEDAGKIIHSGDISLIDFNRTGTPLLEIVTKPDLRSAKEAEILLLQIRQIVRYLNVSDGNMQEGSLRCDANISLALGESASAQPPPLPDYKVEIKNMNSSRFVRLALEYEIARQKDMRARGETPAQETRLWNENHDLTTPMRSKEESMDYRYMPEPDLPRFVISKQFLTRVEDTLVELPYERARRMADTYALSLADARALCADKDTAEYFEQCVAAGADAHTVYKWLFSEVRKHIHRQGTSVLESPITAARLAKIIILLHNGEIHTKIAKQVLEIVCNEGKEPDHIIKERGWKIICGEKLRALLREVIAENPDIEKRITDGEHKLIGFMMGKVMQKSDGQAHPQESDTLIRQLMGIST